MAEEKAPPQRKGARRALWVAVAVIAAGAALGGGYVLKDQCTTHVWDGHQYTSSCYNDIYALYSHRGLRQEPWPYIHGDGRITDDAGQQEAGDLEYPVGTGYFVGAIASGVDGGQAFFRRTALALGVFGALAAVALALAARDRRRILYFALAPSLVLYAFHNWDLLAVWATAVAFLAFTWRDDALTGAALGVGAAAKLYPGLLLPAFALALWRERGRVPVRIVAWGAGMFVAVNLPVFLINREAWLFPWRFQSARFPNYETSWYFLYEHFGATRDWVTGSARDAIPIAILGVAMAGVGVCVVRAIRAARPSGHLAVAAGVVALAGTLVAAFTYFAERPADFWFGDYMPLTGFVSGVLFLGGAAWLSWREWRRGQIRPFVLAFGILMVFLLTAKVYSPQYALWVLPFFVLLRLPWYSFALFTIADAAVWAAISGFFLAKQYDAGDPAFRLNLVELAVWARYAVLAWLLWRSRRTGENAGGPARVGSYA